MHMSGPRVIVYLLCHAMYVSTRVTHMFPVLCEAMNMLVYSTRKHYVHLPVHVHEYDTVHVYTVLHDM